MAELRVMSDKAGGTFVAGAIHGEDNLPERHDSGAEALLTQESSKATIQADRNAVALSHNAQLPALDTLAVRPYQAHHPSPASAGVHLQTNILSATPTGAIQTKQQGAPLIIFKTPVETILHQSLTSPTFHTVAPSLRSNLSTASMASSISPGSALPSPYLAAITDITPLPSPLLGSDSSGIWQRLPDRHPSHKSSRHGSIDGIAEDPTTQALPASPVSPPKRKKTFGSLMPAAVETTMANTMTHREYREASHKHTRNRSISDFVPDALHNVRQRHVTCGPGDNPGIVPVESQMQREESLAAQHGPVSQPVDSAKALPTPPPSNTSVAESEDGDVESAMVTDEPGIEYLSIHCGINNKKRNFRQIRQLGQGTFSKVMLATSERILATPHEENELDPHKLVAVKIVQHGPAGGADEERIGISLKREVEMLKNVSHPSLIHLKACEYQPSRALLVLTYCPGGDLFDLASSHRELLRPDLVQRIFSELVSATRYLHSQWIVHRDIKLENVLVNLPHAELAGAGSGTPQEHPTPLITLTDLGLSRRIPRPPESPLLTTRCGSEDYAAPEILLGQPYDGRATDAWALGVLLYALMEGRLPFDTPPGKPERSRNTHRIARCDWIWCRFGDEDGEWDSSLPLSKDFEGARLCVEGLLKKVRMGRKPLDAVGDMEWVRSGVQVPDGLNRREEDLDGLLS